MLTITVADFKQRLCPHCFDFFYLNGEKDNGLCNFVLLCVFGYVIVYTLDFCGFTPFYLIVE